MTNNTTAPALTDEQIVEIYDDFYTQEDERESSHILPFARALERALLTSPRAAVPAPDGWKLVPIERSYDMRVKALLAFNTTEKETNDRDDALDAAHRAMLDAAPAAPVAEAAPIPMLLFCPRCGTQHIDAEEWADDPHDIEQGRMRVWSNPPHRSHLCHACGIVWRPADVATVGVEAIETSGKADTWTKEAPWIGHNQPAAQAVAADGEPMDDLLQLDVLLAKFHEAIWRAGWRAGAGDDDLIDFDLAGKDEAKAIQHHVRAMIPARAAVSPATPDAQEHYDEIKATLTGAHRIMEGLSAIERRVGPLGSHARGYTHKLTAALRHLDALVAAPAEVRESSVVASGLIGLARHVRAVPAYSKLVGDMDIVDQAIAILNGAPAEARERFDHELIQASNRGYAAGVRDGKVLGALSSTDAREPVATLHDDGHYVWNPKVSKPEGYERAGWKMAVYGVPADAGEAASIENPLTPYGMLVRALRIVAGTTLMDMSTAMNVSPAFLSSLEFGRRPVSFDNATLASQFFSERGIVDTQPALVRAAKESQGAQGGKGGEA
ncbi:putative gp38 [Burkholderia gladioli]|uniref:helix-turn-helix domain-containing protein n=1 Tax=Burkholderia gladioli TaxID=28095 RepID=UPI0005D84A01|nr:helix-turn-helix transcriptional regulator [Burkholderia gladioli]AJW98427.1 putative gp38 [Burkholderia gladioli]ASD79121.1 transcriptional regulator [Burkholderia gladioli pv. gladioli]AWY55636.1 transcriptional regulator [Burkholderia gladioli pv. gladioli]SPV21777.1 Uncharacterised protein [Burkholderia gladioli]